MNKNIYNIKVGFLQTNCWITPLEQENNCAEIPEGFSASIVVDPGEEANRIIALLNQHKLYPLYIILTHGHFDHTGAVKHLVKEYDTQVAIHKDELYDNIKPDIFLCEGDKIGNFTVLHLPGHSKGSIGLLDEKAGILFSGDTLFCDGYGRTDLPGGNTAQLFASLNRLFALDGSIKVYPGHDETTTIGEEISKN